MAHTNNPENKGYNMDPISTFSSMICSHFEALTKQIENAPLTSTMETELRYLETLHAIYTITQPLFNQVAELAKKAGFENVEAFEAWPKGLCENFVFGVTDESGKISSVILAKNKKYQFLQNGGGKTLPNESSQQAALREAQEEFHFDGQIEQIKKITIESESGFPSFNFVKGVYLVLATPEQASQLKLGDDMSSNEKTDLPVDTFMDVTDRDNKPVDHGFDRKWIAKYIKSINSGSTQQNLDLNCRTITEEDEQMAAKAKDWMKNIRVNKKDLDCLKELIQQSPLPLLMEQTKPEEWKSEKNREIIKSSAQKMIDAIVKRHLPEWKYMGKKGGQNACQIKVQEAVGILVNGDPLPAFLTIPQMVALQSKLKIGHKVEIVAISNTGEYRNITTAPAQTLSKFEEKAGS